MQLSRLLFAPLAIAVASLACGSDPAPSPTTIALAPGASASAAISAATGGTVKAGDLVLEIPPGALDADTTITVTLLGTPEQSMFSLQPSGLKFKIPAIAHYTLPQGLVAKLPAERFVAGIRGLYDDDGTSAAYVPTEPDPDGLHLRAPVEHFSAVYFVVVATSVVEPTLLTPEPLQAAVGEEFAVAANYVRVSDDVTLEIHYEWRPSQSLTMPGASVKVTRVGGFAMPASVVDNSPKSPPGQSGFVGVVTPAAVLAKKDDTFGPRGTVFQCLSVGKATAWVGAELSVEGSLVVPNLRLKREPSKQGSYEIRAESGQTTLTLSLSAVRTKSLSVDCSAKTAMMNSLGLLQGDRDKIPARHVARTALSYPDSADKKKHTPTPGTAIGAAQDPLFTVGPGAAARLTTQFPCGDGPSGKTVCGTPGPFAPGDYVMLVSDFDAAIPLADPTWRYQHAFVFDADGIAGNNYVPPAQYPKDFFAGSDKWFQLFYEPGKGWSVKVVDARISNSNPVTSAARFVIAGRELAIFIPRAELNGAAPTFRVTTFRHQGDYGLNGGPVDLSYWPLLGEPLVPAVVGSAIVLPE